MVPLLGAVSGEEGVSTPCSHCSGRGHSAGTASNGTIQLTLHCEACRGTGLETPPASRPSLRALCQAVDAAARAYGVAARTGDSTADADYDFIEAQQALADALDLDEASDVTDVLAGVILDALNAEREAPPTWNYDMSTAPEVCWARETMTHPSTGHSWESFYCAIVEEGVWIDEQGVERHPRAWTAMPSA